MTRPCYFGGTIPYSPGRRYVHRPIMFNQFFERSALFMVIEIPNPTDNNPHVCMLRDLGRAHGYVSDRYTYFQKFMAYTHHV